MLAAAKLKDLELKWAFAYPEAIRARSQPAVLGDTLFVGSQNGSVFAIDKHRGCIKWTFSTIAEVRTGIVAGDDGVLYFGDLVGNVYAVNAADGSLRWRDRPDEHPSLTLTAAPALADGVLYVPLSSLEVTEAADPDYACCTFQGGVAAYEAATGKQLWKGRTIDVPPRIVGRNSVATPRIAPSGAPVWNTPSIDRKRGLLYVFTGENYSSPANSFSDAIVALRLDTGAIAWHRQMTAKDAWNMGCETAERINCPPEDGPDYDFGAATIIATDRNGRDLLLAGQRSGHVHALDLDRDGELVWQRKLGKGGNPGGRALRHGQGRTNPLRAHVGLRWRPPLAGNALPGNSRPPTVPRVRVAPWAGPRDRCRAATCCSSTRGMASTSICPVRCCWPSVRRTENRIQAVLLVDLLLI